MTVQNKTMNKELKNLTNEELIIVLKYLTNKLSNAVGEINHLRQLLKGVEKTSFRFCSELNSLKSWKKKHDKSKKNLKK